MRLAFLETVFFVGIVLDREQVMAHQQTCAIGIPGGERAEYRLVFEEGRPNLLFVTDADGSAGEDRAIGERIDERRSTALPKAPATIR